MDFTIKKLKSLLTALKNHEYKFLKLSEYLKDNIHHERDHDKICILRHDVDNKVNNSLNVALVESDLNIKASFHFRMIPSVFKASVIKEIAKLGHEIGYHYESLVTCKGDIDLAYMDFQKNLNEFRKIVPINTISMHGSPTSKYDNRSIWKKYNYKSHDIIGEPYYDIDYNQFGYLTDTGRKWNAQKSNIRDRVKSKFNLNFRSTDEIIENIPNLPGKIMFNVHTQRWSNSLTLWSAELVKQNIKNVLKYFIHISKEQDLRKYLNF